MNVKLPNGKIAKFPDSMSKEEIKGILQAKFPSDSTENPKGFLQRTGEFAERNINQPVKQNLVRPITNAVGGFGQGMLNVAPGLYNLGASGANALGANVPKSPMFDFAGDSGPSKIGEIASFFAGPGLAFRGAERIPMLAHGIKEASRILGKPNLAKSMAGNALLGGAYSPDNQLLGMGLGAAGPAIGAGVKKGIEYLRPSNFLRGNLTPQELTRNLYMTKGTETGLGDVIGSPMLKRMNENVLSKIPFSGANEAMQRTAGSLVDKGENHLKDLLGSNKGEEFEHELTGALGDFYKKNEAQKSKLYKSSNKIADDLGLKLPLSSFSNVANKYSKAIEHTNILKYEPEFKSLLEKLNIYKNPLKKEKITGKILDKQGRPILNETKTTYPSLEESNLLKAKLNDLSMKYGTSTNMADQGASKIFKELSHALKGDILNSIKNSGSSDLFKAYTTAEENYAKNFSPFLEKEVYKFINGKSDADTIVSSFIKTGKSNDRADLINKLMKSLPEGKKNLLGYGYLQRAIDRIDANGDVRGVLNPSKLKTLLSENALGPRQFKALFPDRKTQRSLMDYSSLVGKNSKALKLMQNPENGSMSMDILPLISKSSGSLGAKLLGAPIVRKMLTSEKTRTNLVKKMIKNSKN